MECTVTKDLNNNLKMVWVDMPTGAHELSLIDTLSGKLIGFEPDKIITDFHQAVYFWHHGFTVGITVYLFETEPQHLFKNWYKLEVAA